MSVRGRGAGSVVGWGATGEGPGSASGEAPGPEESFRLRKRLGQHLLTDRGVLAQVVKAAELGHTDTVIEVGAGLGVLTRELALRAGRVIAVELDQRLALALRRSLAAFPNVEIVQGDILNLPPCQLLTPKSQAGVQMPWPSYKVVANLPYYITSPVLRHFLEKAPRPRLMVVMVQAEVAGRIVAAPGQMSLLSVAVQFYGRPTLLARVPASSFLPSPKVESAILRIDVYPEPPVSVPDAVFFPVVRAGFASRRKQLRNALSHALDISPSEAQELLEEAAIAPQRRAQTLSLEEWAALAWAYHRWRAEREE